jgi:hypothetical protein
MAKAEVIKVDQPVPEGLMTTEQAELIDMMGTDAGQGFENVSIKDVAIPYLAILQSNSPQVKKGPAHIDGAEEGHVLHTVRQLTIDPEKIHVRVVNCGFQKRWVEWKDRDLGGGFVATYKTDEILRKCSKNEKGKFTLSNGNLVVETAYHFVLLVADDGSYEQAVISMASTQLKKSRRLMSQLMSLKLKRGDQTLDAPMFSHTFDVKTVMETKDTNSWFGWDFTRPTMITSPDLYKAAKKFHEVVKDGLDLAPPVPDDTEGEDTSKVTDY